MTFLKKKQNIICLIIIILCVAVMVGLFVYPTIYQKLCQSRTYDDLESKLNDDICSSNIRIVTEVTESGDGIVSYHYGENGCGVIFAQDDDCYYAFTAAHVVDGKSSLSTTSQLDGTEKEKRTYYIVPYGTLTYQEANKKSKQETGTYLATEEYYNQFEKTEAIFVSDSCDIAIIKFKSDKQFKCLEITKSEVDYGDRLVAFGSSASSGSDISYGKVISKEYKTFDSHDGRNTDQVLLHNAYVVEGASGGAVLDENFDIAGITIGGGTDFMGRFKHGVFIPSSILIDVIQEWDANRKPSN